MSHVYTQIAAGIGGAAITFGLLLACPVEEHQCPTPDPELVAPVMQSFSRSTGDAVFCWIEQDGSLGCWPDELRDQPGFPQGEFIWVSIGVDHLCTVREDFTAECWGWGECAHGECEAPDGEWVYIRAGVHVNCGEHLDGSVECWGMEADL